MTSNWVETVMLTAAVAGFVMSVAGVATIWWLFGRPEAEEERQVSDTPAE